MRLFPLLVTCCAILGVDEARSDDVSLRFLSGERTPAEPLEPSAALASVMKVPPTDVRAYFFKDRPTAEAQDRLRALDTAYEHRRNYRTLTPHDVLAYERENHDIALQYVRGLMRAKIGEWLHGSRQYLRQERERGRLRDRAQSEKALVERAQRTPASYGPVTEDAAQAAIETHEGPLKPKSLLLRLLMQTARFFERLTNGGVTADTPLGETMARFDPQSSRLSGRLSNGQVDFVFSYRVHPPGKPMPFRGAAGDPNEERLSVSAGATIPIVGVQSAVGYQVLHRHLACSLSRELAPGLAAHVARSWQYGPSPGAQGRVTSLVQLSYSVDF